MLYNVQEKMPFELSNGIYIDFVDHRFVIIVKDEIWTDYEKEALHRQPLHIYFLYERICGLFLLENVDSIDTSDASFDIHNCDEKDALFQEKCFQVEIYLLNGENLVCAGRSVTFDRSSTQTIKEALKKQSETPYDDAGFDRALAKIQGTYEPFELEPLALVKGIF
jgi:hypothetical protein